MPEWFFIAIAGYLLIAATGVMDKFLVSKVVGDPIVYAFMTAITGPFSLLLAPFGMKWLANPWEYVAAGVSGLAFILAIYFLFAAIKKISISRVVPIQGGLIPLFTVFFAYILLGERLNIDQNIAVIFLVIGSVMISLRKDATGWKTLGITESGLSAFFMALSSVLTKFTFDNSNFVSGMVWTRLSFALAAVFILLFKNNREKIFHAPKKAGVKNVALYYSSRATGTLGGFMQNYAVSLGSVSLVNALQGVQFIFLLILTSFFSVYFPKVLKEKITPDIIALKISAIIMIGCGLVLMNI